MDGEKRRANQRGNQEYFSGKVSEVGRLIGLGLVAASFSLMTYATEFAKTLSSSAQNLLVWVALCGVIAILLDYTQMLFGYASATIAANNSDGDFRQTKISEVTSIVQRIAFFAKQIAAVVGSVLLIVVIYTSLKVPADGANHIKDETCTMRPSVDNRKCSKLTSDPLHIAVAGTVGS